MTASRVEVVFDVAESSVLSDEQKRRVMARCGPRVTATAQDTRSQARNRELALRRLEDRVERALVVQRRRKKTRPGKAAVQRRLDQKRRQSDRKQARRRPESDA